MEKTNQVLEMLRVIIDNIVDNKEAVVIEHGVDSIGEFVSVSVAPEEIGKVIGKQGRTADALRVILKATSTKDSKGMFLKILQPLKYNE